MAKETRRKGERTMIRLTPPQRHRAVKIIRDCFYDYCNKPVTVISDEIQTRFSICFDVDFCVDDNYYEAFDRYTDLSETYTELAYHHMLYKKGTTRRDWFRRVCKSRYFDGDCKE